jgi:lipopolysaccharide transport system permease protein
MDANTLMKEITLELLEAFTGFRRWWRIALFGLKRRFAASILGPLWLVLPNFIYIVAVCYVFSGAFGITGSAYYAHVAYGFLVWTMMLDSMTRGGNRFVAEFGRFSQMKTNLFGIILKDTIERSIVFLINILPCIMLISIVFRLQPRLDLAIPGILLLFINAFMQSYWLSALSARIRDIPHAVSSFMRLAFFITPILWFPDKLLEGARALLVELNPFYYFIEIVRAPLAEGVLPQPILIGTLAWSGINLVLFLGFAFSSHRRIIHDAG